MAISSGQCNTMIMERWCWHEKKMAVDFSGAEGRAVGKVE
jgi:hypothetical protein